MFSDIITNPALFDETGRLVITRFLKETDEPHGCTLGTCSVNICKGKEIQKMINGSSSLARVIYVGDGRNDFCPGTKLGSKDFLFARKNLALHKLLQEGQMTPEGYLSLPNKAVIRASIRYWDTHQDLLELFQEVFP